MRAEGGQRVGVGIYSLATRSYRALNTRCDAVSWLPRSQSILCAAGRSFSLIPRVGAVPSPFLKLPHPIDNQFAVSRDAQFLYFAMAENLTELWLAQSRRNSKK